MKFKIIVIMGVSGCGKSTVGELLAGALGLPFFDGDDYHPKINVDKMAKGIPLNDNDRAGWLRALNALSIENKEKGAVIVCSALKKSYRDQLRLNLEQTMGFIYLKGSFEMIMERLQQRKGHFMPPGLLESQFDTLEPPIDAITVAIDKTPELIVAQIIKELGRN